MEFRLQWVRGAGSHRGQPVPIFDVETWRFYADGRGGWGYRPSAATFLKRLGSAAGVMLLVAILYFGVTAGLPNPQLRPPAPDDEQAAARAEIDRRVAEIERDFLEQGLVTPEEVEQLRAAGTERTAARHAHYTAVQRTVGNVGRTVLGFTALCCVLPLLSLFWEGLRFQPGRDTMLVVRRRGLLGRARTWRFPSDKIMTPALNVRERRRVDGWRSTKGRRVYIADGWTWRADVLQQTDEGPWPCFTMLLQREQGRPRHRNRPPERVRQFLDALAPHVRAPMPTQWSETEYGEREAGIFTDRTPLLTTAAGPPAGVVQTYDAIDEVPAHLRGSVEQLLAQGGGSVSVEAESRGGAPLEGGITYRDRHGNVQRFARLEDMPPELRAKYEAFMARDKN